MKSFNLEEYLKNPSRKVVTRDGRSARIICTDAKVALVKEEYPIAALVEIVKKDKDGEFILSYLKDGRFAKDITSDLDLFFAPEKHEGWINVFKGTSDDYRHLGYSRMIYKSKEDAEEVGDGCSSYITTVKIEWEE